MIILSCSRFIKGRFLGGPNYSKQLHTLHWSLWRRRNQRRSFSIPILAAISWLERIWWLLVPRQLVAMRHLCTCAASRHGGTIPPSPTHLIPPWCSHETYIPLHPSLPQLSTLVTVLSGSPGTLSSHRCATYEHQTWSNILATEINIAKGTRDTGIEYF